MNTIVTFMKRKILLVVLGLSVTLFAFKMNGAKTTDPEKIITIRVVDFVIEKGHYSPSTIDDAFSKGIYKDYIQALDPSKRFFCNRISMNFQNMNYN
jgi:carboxyl-terminal processing protease